VQHDVAACATASRDEEERRVEGFRGCETPPVATDEPTAMTEGHRGTAFGPEELDLRRVSLRPAVASDELFARATHHGAYRDVVERQFGSFEPSAQDGFFGRGWSKPGAVIVVYGDSEAGYARFERTPEALVVHELVLLPAFQGKGVGTELLRAAQMWAAAHGLPVTLQVLRENNAVRLYRRLGFLTCGASGPHLLMHWQPS